MMLRRYNGIWTVGSLNMRHAILAEYLRVAKRRLEARDLLSETAYYLWAHDRTGRLPEQGTFEIAFDEALALRIHREAGREFEVIGLLSLPQEASA